MALPLTHAHRTAHGRRAPASATHPASPALSLLRQRIAAANSPPPLRRRRAANATADGAPPPAPIPQDPLTYRHLLVALVDSNPYLGSNSQGAIAAGADLALAHRSDKITVLLIDEPGESSGASAGADASVRVKTVAWHLRERGCQTEFDFLERPMGEKGAASALVGEVADDVGADLVVLSSQGVHERHIDANLLAEFVSVPVLLLP